MRVLLQGRRVSGERLGGDSTVASQLARELEVMGHEVVVAPTPPIGGVGEFDVVHVINLDRSVLAETQSFARAAVRAARRLIVTPLYWPLDAYIDQLSLGEQLAFRARGTGVARAFHEHRLQSLLSVRRRQAAILAAATAVCPSGRAEGFAISDVFGPLPIHVVPLATAARPVSAPAGRTGVLCVARLDPRKNQLSLIAALRGTGVPLRLIGTPAVFPEYSARCRAAAGRDTEVSGFLSVADLTHAYRTARVHALPSFFELPGLTSLDSAASGLAVVVSRAGTPSDYFGGRAWYCGTDVKSIRKAVLEAYETGPTPELATEVATRFTWSATAEGYLGAYLRQPSREDIR